MALPARVGMLVKPRKGVKKGSRYEWLRYYFSYMITPDAVSTAEYVLPDGNQYARNAGKGRVKVRKRKSAIKKTPKR